MPKVVDVNRIYQATLKVFVARGYDAATMKEIATLAGVNEVTLYRRFKTKSDLISTSLEHALKSSPFAGLTASEDARADVTMIVRAYQQTFAAYGAVVMTLMSEATKNPEIRGAMSALMPNLQNAVAIIAGHQAAGRLKSGNPLIKLLDLIAPLAMMGFVAQSGLPMIGDITPPDPDQIAEEFLNGHSI